MEEKILQNLMQQLSVRVWLLENSMLTHGYAENVYGELDEAEYGNFDFFIPKGAMMYIDSMAIVKNSPNKEKCL